MPGQGAAKQVRRADGDGADIGPDPREQCVPALGMRDAVATGAQLLPAPDRVHRSSIHEIRARTTYRCDSQRFTVEASNVVTLPVI